MESYDEVVFPDPFENFFAHVHNHPAVVSSVSAPLDLHLDEVNEVNEEETKDHPLSRWFKNFSEGDELSKLAAARQQEMLLLLLPLLNSSSIKNFLLPFGKDKSSTSVERMKLYALFVRLIQPYLSWHFHVSTVLYADKQCCCQVSCSWSSSNLCYQVCSEVYSTRKRESVICRYPDGRLVLYKEMPIIETTNGADTVIYERLAGGNNDIKKRTQDHMERYGATGLQTLCLPYKDDERVD